MATIKTPRDPRPSDDTCGPNFPSSIDPGFNDPYRNKGGDTVGAGDFAGRRKAEPRDPWGWPISRR